MYSALPYKTKQFFFVLIKLSIVFGAFYFIYNKLVNNDTLDFVVFYEYLSKNKVFSLKNSLFLIFLSVLNWLLEVFKWQNLVGCIQKIDFKTALKQSLGSLTASIFTPNRIGEYGAKAIYYPKSFRKRILLLNFIGNLFQLLVTVILGLVGLYCFTHYYNLEINYNRSSRFFIIILVITGFSIFGLQQSRFKIKGFSIKKIKVFFKKLPIKTKTLTFVFSVLRYAVFSFQLYYILILFGVEITYFKAMIVITSMYLMASIIPTLFIFDVVVKGSIAVYLFSIVGVNAFTIVCAITLMWLLNFALPSLLGSYFVSTFTLPKQKD
ncbi:hypothetical protein [Lacinutrix salivirga]